MNHDTSAVRTSPASRTPAVRHLNPSAWNAAFAYDQAQLRPMPAHLLTLAGQGPMSADGELLGVGDVRAQLAVAMANVEQLLELGGMDLGDVLSMTVYVTDMGAALAGYSVVTDRMRAAGAAAPATLVEVSRLAVPGMQVEITATAGR